MRIRVAAVIFAGAFVGLSSSAHAICAIPEASYPGGLFGTSVVTSDECSTVAAAAGGIGVLAATLPLASGMSGSADLVSGVLTAFSNNGAASASEWDTFTFMGLPAGGGIVTATLSLAGSTITGFADGLAEIQVDPSSVFPLTATAFFDAATGVPASIALPFPVDNLTPVTLFAEIFADGDNGFGTADLGDPPTLSLTLPPGATGLSASGVFEGFGTGRSVPEPGSLVILLAGLGLLGYARRAAAIPTG